jgi:hypothetical protein
MLSIWEIIFMNIKVMAIMGMVLLLDAFLNLRGLSIRFMISESDMRRIAVIWICSFRTQICRGLRRGTTMK